MFVFMSSVPPLEKLKLPSDGLRRCCIGRRKSLDPFFKSFLRSIVKPRRDGVPIFASVFPEIPHRRLHALRGASGR